jgi:ketosteroid isomerase-like protein
MSKHPIGLPLVLNCLAPIFLCAQESTATPSARADDEAIHNELRELREDLTKALIAGDVDRQLEFAHKNIVTTWQNNDVTRGHDGLKAFLSKMDDGKQKVFQGYTQRPEADDLSIIYSGDAAIAFGSSVPHYKILGMEFDLKNRWTATLVKEDDRWLIAAYHVSSNVLDNPVLDAAKHAVYWTAGIALVGGIALGFIGSAVVRRIRLRAAR